MSAVASTVRRSTLVADALAYHAAVLAQAASHHTSAQLLSNAYLSLEGALASMRAVGTMIPEVIAIEAMAHKLAPVYECHRAVTRELNDRARRTRDALGYDRHLGDTLRELADEIGDDTAELEATQGKLLEVASMVECEE